MPYKWTDTAPMDLYLGELEQLVLLALARLDDNAYGVTIRQAVLEGTGRNITLGTVYKTLWRLEQKKFVSCWIADPTQERGGRRKKMYELNPLGKRALRQSLDGLRRMTEGLGKEFSRP
jgi:PadR family transcriptional regulator, regulatory protein PadR